MVLPYPFSSALGPADFLVLPQGLEFYSRSAQQQYGEACSLQNFYSEPVLLTNLENELIAVEGGIGNLTNPFRFS